MPGYRVYILDKQGQLMAAVNFDCTDDDAAKEYATPLADGHEVQVWRLVAQFKAHNRRPNRQRSALAH
jgi:hypothetical protein